MWHGPLPLVVFSIPYPSREHFFCLPIIMSQTTPKQKLQDLLEGKIERALYPKLVDTMYESFRTVDHAHDLKRSLSQDLEQSSGEERKDLEEKLGILCYLMGEYESAVAHLTQVEGRKDASYFLGRAYKEAHQFDKSLQALKNARKGDADFEVDMLIADVLCCQRKDEEARQICERYSRSHSNDPDWLYVMGRVLETEGQYGDAMGHYEMAIEKDDSHKEALFRLALNCDLNGENERAIALYQRCAKLQPTFLGALINLGVLYEDQGDYEKAVDCYEQVLAADPAHKRARLFLKDAEASQHMVTDEEKTLRFRERTNIMQLPLSNLEFSTRTENVLEKLNVNTLGELASLTKEELLQFKNFGEASLSEIQEVLARNNIRLKSGKEAGETAASGEKSDEGEAVSDSEDKAEDDIMSASVAKLGFTGRVAKCIEHLGIETVGELLEYTADELLATPNFGRSSLKDVEDKLSEFGLGLKESSE